LKPGEILGGWGIVRILRKLAAAAVATVMVALAVASVAAATPVPTGEFAPFGDCPLGNSSIEECVHAEFESGALEIGLKTIPIVNPITLQGGYEGSGSEIQFHGAEDGDTLSKPAEPVPGGLLGLTPPGSWPAWLREAFNETVENGLTGISATIELAAPATSIGLNLENLLLEEGTALSLPVKIKLDNPFLGSNCYIGSNAEPIVINLTTGTSGSLQGSAGTVTFNGPFTLATLSNTELVNETFAVPGANGCGGIASALVDPWLDSILGIPAASGQNSLTLKGMIGVAEAAAVNAAIM
jgi:hypothetical protein